MSWYRNIHPKLYQTLTPNIWTFWDSFNVRSNYCKCVFLDLNPRFGFECLDSCPRDVNPSDCKNGCCHVLDWKYHSWYQCLFLARENWMWSNEHKAAQENNRRCLVHNSMDKRKSMLQFIFFVKHDKLSSEFQCATRNYWCRLVKNHYSLPHAILLQLLRVHVYNICIWNFKYLIWNTQFCFIAEDIQTFNQSLQHYK